MLFFLLSTKGTHLLPKLDFSADNFILFLVVFGFNIAVKRLFCECAEIYIYRIADGKRVNYPIFVCFNITLHISG